MRNNHITAEYLSNLSAKKDEERETMIKADAEAFVDDLLVMAEYDVKTFGVSQSKFNRSRIPHGKKGEALVCNILQSRGFKVYRDKKNAAIMVFEWPRKTK